MINGKKCVFMVHTSPVSLADLKALFAELAPEAVVQNIIDDSLLAEVLKNGGVTEGVRSRLREYYKCAEAAGADLIFNQCSSVGEAADLAAQHVRVPVLKVDVPMAEKACLTGRRIGVVATLPTTLGPTCRLIRKTAERLGRQIEVVEALCEGAFDKLVAGDRKTHNEMVIATIRDLARRVDVIVCAQGSMVALLPDLGQTPVPVLTSLRLGVERAAQMLAKQ
jgi:aspartate/glutamate racemase